MYVNLPGSRVLIKLINASGETKVKSHVEC